MTQPMWAGLDVSGKWLDVGSHPQRETIRLPYTDAGLADLLVWLDGRAIIGVAIRALALQANAERIVAAMSWLPSRA